MSYQVYISYSAKDSMLAKDLRRRLKDVGIGFVTAADTTDARADYVRRKIRDAMKRTSEVIALLTDNSVNNQWLLYEVGIADAEEVPVTFVIVNEGVEQQLPIVGNQFVRYADLPQYLSSLKKR